MSRLDAVSPELAEAFRKAPPAKLRRAALVACEFVVSKVGLDGDEVAMAFDLLRRAQTAGSAASSQFEALAARLDEEYFRLDEAGDSKKMDALRTFSKARAAAALGFALSGDTATLSEAIYEAISAMDDPGELLRAVGQVLLH